MSQGPADATVVLPDAWLGLFDGTRLADKAGEAAILASVDAEGWSHLAFMSVGEVLAESAARVHIATWAASRTTQNLRLRSQASLFAAVAGEVWEARLAMRIGRADDGDGLVLFSGDVGSARRHPAPYARVLGLVAFQLTDAAAAVARWERQVALLRAQYGADSHA
jgi:hypothetical protein